MCLVRDLVALGRKAMHQAGGQLRALPTPARVPSDVGLQQQQELDFPSGPPPRFGRSHPATAPDLDRPLRRAYLLDDDPASSAGSLCPRFTTTCRGRCRSTPLSQDGLLGSAFFLVVGRPPTPVARPPRALPQCRRDKPARSRHYRDLELLHHSMAFSTPSVRATTSRPKRTSVLARRREQCRRLDRGTHAGLARPRPHLSDSNSCQPPADEPVPLAPAQTAPPASSGPLPTTPPRSLPARRGAGPLASGSRPPDRKGRSRRVVVRAGGYNCSSSSPQVRSGASSSAVRGPVASGGFPSRCFASSAPPFFGRPTPSPSTPSGRPRHKKPVADLLRGARWTPPCRERGTRNVRLKELRVLRARDGRRGARAAHDAPDHGSRCRRTRAAKCALVRAPITNRSTSCPSVWSADSPSPSAIRRSVFPGDPFTRLAAIRPRFGRGFCHTGLMFSLGPVLIHSC